MANESINDNLYLEEFSGAPYDPSINLIAPGFVEVDEYVWTVSVFCKICINIIRQYFLSGGDF